MDKVLVIVGPTAVGKTSLSIQIAKQYNGEVINGDSVQIYKTLNIGSAKVTKEEMNGIKHHLIDIKNPHEGFSVAEFQRLVREKIVDINKDNKLPIIVGGTGLYIQAVLYDFKFESEGRNLEYIKQYENVSNEELYQKLISLDSNSAEAIHKNNRRRILRALEIYHNSQRTKSELINEQSKELLYNTLIIGLDMPRDILYERINKRVDIMMNQGLLKEVGDLYKQGIKVNAIGYKEFTEYFENKKTIEEVTQEIKKDSRHYAKRQLTYFRNKLKVNWFDVDIKNPSKTMLEVSEYINMWLNS